MRLLLRTLAVALCFATFGAGLAIGAVVDADAQIMSEVSIPLYTDDGFNREIGR